MSVRLLALVCSVFLFFSPLSAFAFTSATNANTVTFVPTVPTPSSIGGYSVSTASDGTVLLKQPKRMNLPGGRSIPLDVTGGVPKSNVAGALGRFARKTLPVLGVGVALYELGQELGFKLDNSSGELVVQKPSPGVVCTTAPCWQYRGNALSSRPWDYNPVSACQLHSSLSGASYVGISGSGASVYCHNSMTTFLLMSQSAPPQVPTYTPSTIQELTDAIAAKSGWPTSSALGRATVDAIKSGESLQVQPQTVTGPATSPGPVVRTVNNTDDTTKTSTTTHHHTYAGPSVTTTTTTTTVTINNITNEVIDSSTTTEEPVIPEDSEESESAPVDTPLGAVPKLYDPKYPDGLVGVWNDKKEQLSATPLMSLLGELMPSVGSAGTCPVWSMTLDLGFIAFGTHDLSVPCWIWEFAGLVIVLSALLLARSLVFGG